MLRHEIISNHAPLLNLLAPHVPLAEGGSGSYVHSSFPPLHPTRKTLALLHPQQFCTVSEMLTGIRMVVLNSLSHARDLADSLICGWQTLDHPETSREARHMNANLAMTAAEPLRTACCESEYAEPTPVPTPKATAAARAAGAPAFSHNTIVAPQQRRQRSHEPGQLLGSRP